MSASCTTRAFRSATRAGLPCAAILVAAWTGDVVRAADHELVSAVVVSRHGVRSPIAEHPPLASYAADPWPAWPVPPGYLTLRGAELARLLGVYYRDRYAAQGLFAATGCPAAGLIDAWADVDQRTRVTAQSLLDGMFPGCGLAPGYRTDARVDALFHPTRAGVCQIDPERARETVAARAGGSLATLTTTYRTEIAAMQAVLKCCTPALCIAAGAGAACGLADLPTTVATGHEGGSLVLSGAIGIGSTAAEVFLLEYAQDFPSGQVAWGRVATPQAMRPLLRLHTLQFDLLYRTPYLAARQASAMVERIVSALRGAAEMREPAPSRLTLLVGHDTNLAGIGGVLGLHWSLPSYLPDQTPPAGALHFELLRERSTGAYGVRAVYIAQTLDQMRRAIPLDRTNPPETATTTFERCGTDAAGLCPWSAFTQLAAAAIDRNCVPPPRP